MSKQVRAYGHTPLQLALNNPGEGVKKRPQPLPLQGEGGIEGGVKKRPHTQPLQGEGGILFPLPLGEGKGGGRTVPIRQFFIINSLPKRNMYA
ncbi:MAG: hypothetical protein B6242_11135 [Anaerolineaceae bacterium 4572_78]|nr:MAG: hypothetical protein B6242_11135 [Anaerolineaceae bacterium 4572_78]